MGKWSATVTLDSIVFDGDSITFTVNRMLTEDMTIMSKYFDPDTGKLKFNSNTEICEVAADLLPKRVVGMVGMTKADGSEFTLQEFNTAAKEFYFAPLLGELFAKLMSISVVGVQAKNSVPPLPEQSVA